MSLANKKKNKPEKEEEEKFTRMEQKKRMATKTMKKVMTII